MSDTETVTFIAFFAKALTSCHSDASSESKTSETRASDMHQQSRAERNPWTRGRAGGFPCTSSVLGHGQIKSRFTRQKNASSLFRAATICKAAGRDVETNMASS